MQKLLLFTVISLICYTGISQNLVLNPKNNFYEASQITLSDDPLIMKKFNKRFEEINLTDINQKDDIITAQGITNHLVMGFASVEISYKVKVSFKQDKFRVLLTNFVVSDKNGSNPLEGMRSYKKMWIKKINKKLPDIFKNIENVNSDEEEW